MITNNKRILFLLCSIIGIFGQSYIFAGKKKKNKKYDEMAFLAQCVAKNKGAVKRAKKNAQKEAQQKKQQKEQRENKKRELKNSFLAELGESFLEQKHKNMLANRFKKIQKLSNQNLRTFADICNQIHDLGLKAFNENYQIGLCIYCEGKARKNMDTLASQHGLNAEEKDNVYCLGAQMSDNPVVRALFLQHAYMDKNIKEEVQKLFPEKMGKRECLYVDINDLFDSDSLGELTNAIDFAEGQDKVVLQFIMQQRNMCKSIDYSNECIDQCRKKTKGLEKLCGNVGCLLGDNYAGIPLWFPWNDDIVAQIEALMKFRNGSEGLEQARESLSKEYTSGDKEIAEFYRLLDKAVRVVSLCHEIDFPKNKNNQKQKPVASPANISNETIRDDSEQSASIQKSLLSDFSIDLGSPEKKKKKPRKIIKAIKEVFEYAERVHDWFTNPESRYENNGLSLAQAKAFHTFSEIVDQYAYNKKYSLLGTVPNKPHCVSANIPGEIVLVDQKNPSKTKKFAGIFTYGIDETNKEKKLCWHRCFQKRTFGQLMAGVAKRKYDVEFPPLGSAKRVAKKKVTPCQAGIKMEDSPLFTKFIMPKGGSIKSLLLYKVQK